MAYTAIDNPELYFQTKLYTGDGSTPSITLDGDTDMQPDLVWIKNRDATDSHCLFDSVRTATEVLHSDATTVETTDADTLTSFDSDGFALGADVKVNTDTEAYVAWCWKAGTAFSNDASATSIGDIDSSGSASDASGFSIVSYTGTGSAGTIKHGLSTAPVITLIKTRTGVVTNWNFLTYQIDGSCDELALNLSSEGKTDRSITAPTSSVFSVDTAEDRNGSGVSNIAYCFAPKQGYSKFGSYTGNGDDDGVFIYTGFKPAFVITRQTNSANYWHIHDNKRNTFNVVNTQLQANDSGVDNTPAGGENSRDFLSNGFKFRDADHNNQAHSYIYIAFAEAPFVNSNGVPCNAR